MEPVAKVSRQPSTTLLTLNSADRRNGSWNSFILQRPQNLINSEAKRIRVKEVRMPFFINNVNKFNNSFWYRMSTSSVAIQITISTGFYTPLTIQSAINNAIRAQAGMTTNSYQSQMAQAIYLAYDGVNTPITQNGIFTFRSNKNFMLYWTNPNTTTLTDSKFSMMDNMTMTPAQTVVTPDTSVTTTVVTPATTSVTPGITTTIPAQTIITPGTSTTTPAVVTTVPVVFGYRYIQPELSVVASAYGLSGGFSIDKTITGTFPSGGLYTPFFSRMRISGVQNAVVPPAYYPTSNNTNLTLGTIYYSFSPYPNQITLASQALNTGLATNTYKFWGNMLPPIGTRVSSSSTDNSLLTVTYSYIGTDDVLVVAFDAPLNAPDAVYGTTSYIVFSTTPSYQYQATTITPNGSPNTVNTVTVADPYATSITSNFGVTAGGAYTALTASSGTLKCSLTSATLPASGTTIYTPFNFPYYAKGTLVYTTPSNVTFNAIQTTYTGQVIVATPTGGTLAIVPIAIPYSFTPYTTLIKLSSVVSATTFTYIFTGITPPVGSKVWGKLLTGSFWPTVIVKTVSVSGANITLSFDGAIDTTHSNIFIFTPPPVISATTTIPAFTTTTPDVTTVIPASTVTAPSTTTTIPGTTSTTTTIVAGTTTIIPATSTYVPAQNISIPAGQLFASSTLTTQELFNSNTNMFRLLGFTNEAHSAPSEKSVTEGIYKMAGDVTDLLYTRFLDIVSNSLHRCATHHDGNSSTRAIGDVIARLFVADDASVGNYVPVSGYAQVGWNPSIIHRQFKDGKTIGWSPNSPISDIDISIYDEFGNLAILPEQQNFYNSGAYPEFQIVLSVSED